MTDQEIFNDWTGPLSQGFGVADDLRCAAMEFQEEGRTRKSFLACASARGYNTDTASRCWSYVAAQMKETK